MNVHRCLSQIIFCSRTSAACSLTLCLPKAQKHKITSVWLTSSPTSIWVSVLQVGEKKNNNKNPLITRRCCVLEQLTNTPQHLTGSSPQSLQCTTDAGKQSNRSFGCCACKQPALICRIFPPGGGPPRRSVIVSAPLILLAGGWWSLTWGDGGLGQSFFIRLHRSSYPLETEKRGRGWTSCTSSSESRERDGAEGAETRFRDAAQRCRCVFVCDGETEKVCECVEQTFGLRVLRLAELAVRFWLQIWGNEQREGEEQNLDGGE